MAILEIPPATRRLGFFWGSGRCHKALATWGRDLPPAAPGQKRIVENLWREFFLDPSQWWDHRSGKLNARYPDFKHKTTQHSLWLNGKLNPTWVEAELAAMIPGTVQSNIFSWNKILASYVKAGQNEKTIDIFQQMQQQGLVPNRYTFVPVLNACASLRALDKGRDIHEQIIESKCESDVFLENSLVDMYTKCGRIDDAWRVFNKMPQRDVVSWNIMILGHVKCGEGKKALELSQQMQQEGVELDHVTYVGVLNACASLAAFDEGRRVHEQVIQSGCESDVFVGSSLIDMYSKCGRIDDAWRVFRDMPTRNVVSWNTMIQGYVKCGQGLKALELSQKMQKDGVEPGPGTFVAVVNACGSLAALDQGRRVHELIIQSGCETDVFVGSSLVDMYSKCGRIEEAWSVFNKMPVRDVVSWNAIIQGYVKCGEGQRALDLSRHMRLEGVEPDIVTLVGLLNACASTAGALEEGRRVHEQVVKRGCESDIFVGSSLVDMYAKCGSIEDAWSVFNKMPRRDVVAWSAMIQGYAKCGQGQRALELYQQMQNEGLEPDHVTLVGFLNACSNVGAIEEGRRGHKLIIEKGWEANVFLGSSLVDMYAKCGSIDEARGVFDKMPTRDVVAWGAMIHGYVKCGQGQNALELSGQMQLEGLEPDRATFVGLVNACASLEDLEEGKHVHNQIIRSGFESDVMVGSSLVDMYAKCGRMGDAWRVFNKMPTHNVVTWNALIQGHLKCGQGQKALELAQTMEHVGVELDRVSFVAMVNACTAIGALEDGRVIHGKIIQRGWESDAFVACSLVDMYMKCDSIEDAWSLFERMPKGDVAAWNAMILGCLKCGQAHNVMNLFHRMQREGVEPVPMTFVAVLNACATLCAFEEGKSVHELIIKAGLESHVFVGSSLIGMYAKCGSTAEAQRVFDRMPIRDVVAWSLMILGYAKCGQGEKALELFRQMNKEGVEPDLVTFVGSLNACASVAALDEGRRVHDQIIQRDCESDVFVGSSLIDMYAKCGSIEDAQNVFKKMAARNVVSWNAMLGGYAMHGHCRQALAHFELMCERGVEIDTVSFVSLLSACSHAGLVDEGLHYFESMGSVYNVTSTLEHHSCMVDLLGRAGRLHEAERLMETMSCEPDVAVWMSLLGACRIHGNVEMGEGIGKRVLQLDPGNAAGYVLLSNIYAASGQWASSASIKQQRLDNGVNEQPGRTWIEVNNQVHSFTADDQQHPQMTQIRAELQSLSGKLEEAGYVPDSRFVLHDIEEDKNLSQLGHHSEKLGVAFGLINTPPGTPLRIFQNLRVCDDCHSAIKLISKIVERSIIVRDAKRFHHFEDGECSCREYW